MLDTMLVIDNLTKVVQNVVNDLPIKSAKFRGHGSEWHKENMTVFVAAIETNYHSLFVIFQRELHAQGAEISVSYINPSTNRVETFAWLNFYDTARKLHYLLRNLTCCEYCAKMVIRE